MTRSKKNIKSCVSRPPPPQSGPWLMFSHGKCKQSHTFFSVSEDRCYLKNIPQMRDKYICTSSHGWLVMLGIQTDDFFLLNPVSMETIVLPPMKSTYEICILSSPPNDPDCTIVFINNSNVMFCRPADDEWTEQELGFGDEYIQSAITCGGKIYGLTSYDQILVMIEIGSTPTVKQLGVEVGVRSSVPGLPGTVMWATYLLESCGEVFVVVTSFLGSETKIVRDMEVAKMDFSTKAWVKVESLGDRAFFFGPYTCFSCSASEYGMKGSSIYFTGIEEDRNMYLFDLEDKCISISLPCPNVVHNWAQPEWVKPFV